MHSQIAESEASNQPHPRVFQTRKYKRINNARYRQKKKKEFEGFDADQNKYLKDIIERLISDYSQIPAIDLQKQENSVSHSAGENDHPSFYVRDHQGVDSDIGGTAEELDGLELNDLPDDQLPDEVENPKNSVTMTQQNMMAEFLKKIDDDVASNIDFTDFMIYFDGEQKTIGRYTFPLSLVPTVEKINNVYGDVSAASLMNSNVTRQIYLFFCATIKEMDDLQLHQVTEEKMLKWRDAIKDALRIKFKVDFAMDHLKNIARAYFGRIGSQVLQTIDDQLNALNKERAKTYEDFKDILADAKDFYGKSVSTGLFP
ncbi:hypothetical protein CRYUN_Cryun26dG0103600 [Craigia yunnanensis]